MYCHNHGVDLVKAGSTSNNVSRTISKKQTQEVKRYINESAEWTPGKHLKGWKLCQFQPNQYKQNKNQSGHNLVVSLTNYQTITFTIGGSYLPPYTFHQLGSKWVHNNLPTLKAENPTKIYVLIFCQVSGRCTETMHWFRYRMKGSSKNVPGEDHR
jgi:hypothetical protein